MKYKYDTNVLKDLGIGAFLNLEKQRVNELAKGEDSYPISEYNVNKLAKALHPELQYCVIKDIIEHKNAKSYILIPNENKGTKSLAYFRAGQYVCVKLFIDKSFLSRPYSIRSNPKDALGDENNSYTLTIKAVKDGYVSNFILNNWKIGDEVTITGPLGDRFYYERIRDAKNVLAIAGGSGITPFYSMAKAIESGIEDFNLTIIYGSKTEKDILLKDELATLKSKKIKVVHVLSDEEKRGYEHGFITLDLIRKYQSSSDYSIFMCGPKAMYDFVEKQIEPLNLPKRRIRKEMNEFGNPINGIDYPKEKITEIYKLTVKIRDKETTIDCKANESLLVAMERAGIKAPSRCRSGECGWCHSLLISGNVYIPKEQDLRRLADKKFGWIHPCITYPLSDCVIEVKSN